MKRLFLIALPVLAACAAGAAQPPIVFDPQTVMKHRLAGEDTVAVPEGARGVWEGVTVIVTVSPEGKVVSAEFDAKENHDHADPRPALAAARSWRFRPFEYRGKPVAARGTVKIAYQTPRQWRDPDAPFPSIDYPSLKISLVRSACYGSCPDYSVTIDGSGAVLFTTRWRSLEGAAEVHRQFSPGPGVLLPGEHRAQIGRPALDALIERFRAAHFFGLKRQYRARITDNPTYVLRFETGGRSWTVTDYVGKSAGMPAIVTQLEDAVDAAAGTGRWVQGDETSVAALKGEGFDFSSRRAGELTAYAAMAGDASDGMIVGLIEAGVGLDQPLAFDIGDRPAPLGETLLVAAVAKHRPQLFGYLEKKGWLGRVQRAVLSEAFAAGGGGCDAAVARALVAAGADPNKRTKGQRGLEQASGMTALMAALEPYGPCYRVDPGPVVTALAALGVDLNAADDDGQTALYGVEDPELQEQLLALGARADVRDKNGNSPIFSSWNDRIVLGLLDAGASPDGRYDDGKSLREQALAQDMPSVLAWLDRRGPKSR